MRSILGCLLPLLLCITTAAASDQRPNPPAPSTAIAPHRLKVADEASEARRATVAALIAKGRSSAPRALELLESAEAGDRAAAIYVLASIRETAAVPLIVRALAGDSDGAVRIQAAAALGVLGAAGGIDALIHAIEADANRDVRVRAIAAIGRIDSPRVIAPIRRAVQAPRSDAEFQAAAIAAGHRRIAAVEPDLIAVGRDVDRSEHARGAATIALGLLGTANARTAVLRLVKDTSPVVRFNAITAIEELNDTSAVDDVRQIFDNAGEELYVRIRAASSLAHMRTVESLDALRLMAAGPDEAMAMHAIVALRQADASQARELAAALRARAKDPFVEWAADRIASGLPLPWGQR